MVSYMIRYKGIDYTALQNVCCTRTRPGSVVDAECLVEYVESVISWLKWNSFINSVILLSLFRVYS